MVEIEAHGERVRKILKFLVLGDRHTGKTSLIRRYVHNCFTEHYRCTIAVDFAHKDFDIDDHLSVSVQLWDVSGQERFHDLTRMYYAGSVDAMIVFDISNPNTPEAATIWKSDIEQKVVSASGEPVPVILVGNKIDLVPNGWHMTMDQMEQFRLAHKFVGYIETNAKTAQNVNEAVRALVDYVVESGTIVCAEDAQGIRLADRVEREPSGCC